MDPISLSTLKQLLAYNRWASTRLVQAVSSFESPQLVQDFGTADKSILGTLGHLLVSEKTWLARVRRTPILPELRRKPDTMAEISDDWPRIQDGWAQWSEDLTQEALLSPIAYEDWKGQHWSTPPWQIILHVVNHSTHHRGQAAGFVRALGSVPPSLDLIAFYRSST